jgi:carbon storage regulator CsrA
MLVLSRKPGQSLVVPEYNLEFVVEDIRGSQVRIGINAPPHVEVWRKEILNRPGFSDRRANAATEHQPVVDHDMRNRLNSMALKAELVNRLIKQTTNPDPQLVRMGKELAAEAAAIHGLLKPKTNPVAPLGGIGPDTRILLVEDDRCERESLAELLRLAGHQNVDTAPSKDSALAKIRTTKYDLVLLDLGLGGSDGVDILFHLRQRPDLGNPRVVVVSARDEQRNLRADAWFQKPLQPDQIVQCLECTV